MDVSTLADLKAELARKKDEARRNKISLEETRSSGPKKSDAIWAKKKKEDKTSSVSKGTTIPKVDPDEERRVQTALELKARLYDKMKSGQVEDKDERFLINFKQDPNNDDSDSDDDPMSEAARREILRKKWEQTEMDNAKKSDLHYQDVLFDEARSHGAAFYSFSRDEEKRAKEMAGLKEIHAQTQKEREEKEKVKLDRKAALKKRLKKVRDKKRQKLGLPPLESEEEDSVPEPEPPKVETSLEDDILKSLREIREKDREEQRKAKVREWDRGKKPESILTEKPTERKILSQSEWVEEKRSERPSEFAPPVNLYSEAPKKKDHRVGYAEPNYSGSDFDSHKKFAPRGNGPSQQTDQYPDRNQQTFQSQPQKKKKNKKSKNKKQKSNNAPPPQQSFSHQQNHQGKFSQSANHYSNVQGSYQPAYDAGNQYSSLQDTTYHQFAQNTTYNDYSNGQQSTYSYAQEAPHSQYSNAAYNYGVQTSTLDNQYPNVSGKYDDGFNETLEYSSNQQQQEANTNKPLSLNSRLELHKKMIEGTDMSVPIVNELEEPPEDIPLPAAPVGKGVEIPPPCDMEYFASTNKRSNWQGSRTRQELNDAFQFGMNQLKKTKRAQEDEESESEDES